jgi:hypothetical protein
MQNFDVFTPTSAGDDFVDRQRERANAVAVPWSVYCLLQACFRVHNRILAGYSRDLEYGQQDR